MNQQAHLQTTPAHSRQRFTRARAKRSSNYFRHILNLLPRDRDQVFPPPPSPCAIRSRRLSDNSKDGIERPRPYSYRPHAEVLNLIGNLEVCGDDKLVSLSLSGRVMDTSMSKRAFLDVEIWSPGENSVHVFTFHPLSTRIHPLYLCMQPCRRSFFMSLSPFR